VHRDRTGGRTGYLIRRHEPAEADFGGGIRNEPILDTVEKKCRSVGEGNSYGRGSYKKE